MNRSKESLKRELDTHRTNLDRLEERKASYGLNPPLDLLNAIDLERQAIARIEALLAEGPEQATPTELSEAAPAAQSPGKPSSSHISGGKGIAVGEGAKAIVAEGDSTVISESNTTTPPTPPLREEAEEAAPSTEKTMLLRVAIAAGGVVIFLAAVGLLTKSFPVLSPQFVILLLIVAAAIVLGAMGILSSEQVTTILTGMTKSKVDEKAEDEGEEPS